MPIGILSRDGIVDIDEKSENCVQLLMLHAGMTQEAAVEYMEQLAADRAEWMKANARMAN